MKDSPVASPSIRATPITAIPFNSRTPTSARLFGPAYKMRRDASKACNDSCAT
jgi:hypothetical protein